MTKPLTPDPLPHKSVDGYDGPPPPDDWGTDLDRDLTELDPAQEWDDYLASVNDETEVDCPPIPTWQREGEFLVGSIKGYVVASIHHPNCPPRHDALTARLAAMTE